MSSMESLLYQKNMRNSYRFIRPSLRLPAHRSAVVCTNKNPTEIEKANLQLTKQSHSADDPVTDKVVPLLMLITFFSLAFYDKA